MMKRLNKFIEKVGIDKVMHFAVGGWAKKRQLGLERVQTIIG